MDTNKKYFKQPISEQIWYDSYKWETDNSIEDTWRRVAKDISSVEKDSKTFEEAYYNLLKDFKFIPGGRILSNAGTSLGGTTYLNCFVSDIPEDSVAGIYEGIRKQATILKSEGGYGCNFSKLRPRGSYIAGSGVTSPGPVKFMELWDKSSEIVTCGSGVKTTKGKNKIRKGAMMGVLHVAHPDIEEFILAKRTAGKLTKFNMSVLISDEFMKAVKNHAPFNLVYPELKCEEYKNWDGDLTKWIDCGNPVKIYKTFSDANELWDIIMKSTYTYNEPGVLFEGTINSKNNLKHFGERLIASNPCAEQTLPTGGACCLGSINMAKYVNNSTIDYDSLEKDIPLMVRFLDNVLDNTKLPLEEEREEVENKRRIGLGYTGIGSTMALLGIDYGSEEAIALINKLFSFVTNTAYMASTLLAKEKGPFKIYDNDKYLESEFVKDVITSDVIESISKYGIRNSHITTCAPTGTTSLLANNVSSGVEPVVSSEYIRTVIVPQCPDGLVMPKNINWDSKSGADGWNWICEGKDTLVTKTYNGVIYKIDKNRGLTKEEKVIDYSKLIDPEVKIKTLFDCSLSDHVNMLKCMARYIDSSISKTVNVPETMKFEEFKSVYLDAYTSGIKGITTYRAGTMASVIKTKDTVAKDVSGKRPKELHCDIHRLTIAKNGIPEKWVVFVGIKDNHPIEVFSGKIDEINIPKTVTSGIIHKVKRGHYSLIVDGETIVNDIGKSFNNEEHDAFSRMISISLRNGTPVDYIVDQLNKSKGTISDFTKSLARSLKKYIKDGTVSNDKCPNCGEPLIFIEGCKKCKSCSYSACG